MRTLGSIVIVLLASIIGTGFVFGGQSHFWHGVRTPVPLSTAGDGFTDWQWLHPLPHGNGNCALWLFDSTTWIVAGEVGAVIKTTNAGKTWAIQFSVDGQVVMKRMAFIDRSQGFIVGEDLIQTIDGGTTWLIVDNTHHGAWNDVAFGSHDTGYVVGKGGMIKETTDGGSSWRDTIVDASLNLLRISVCDARHAFALAEGNLVKTTDGGVHWAIIPFADIRGTNGGICFTDSTNGWTVGWTYDEINPNWENAFIRHTTDGGVTWSSQEYTTGEFGHSYIFNDVSFADLAHGTIVGGGNALLWTTDGGTNWTVTDGLGLISVRYLDTTMVVAVGGSGRVFLSTNSGSTWTDVVEIGEYQTALTFPDPARGYALGGWGYLLRTDDGGNKWLRSQVTEANDMAFKDIDHGIIVGAYEALLTSDGGLNWNHVDLGPYCNGKVLWTVCMQGDSIWAAGAGGLIIFSSDGGQSWATQTSGTTYNFGKIRFVNATHGTAIGQGGVIDHTTDGGKTWVIQDSPAIIWTTDVFFLDENVGYITSDAGILKTTNGGNDWNVVNPAAGGAIWFSDEMNGVLVSLAANMGTYMFTQIYRTTNGGVDWTFWNNPGTVGLSNVIGVKSGPGYVLYASGGGGAILVAAMSPQNTKTWTWTGAADESWNDPANWFPQGVPQPGDSVLVMPADHNPIMDSMRTQITIGSLHIFPGGMLTITDSLGRLIVLGDVIIEGKLEVLPTANPNIIVGGNWTVNPGGHLEERSFAKASSGMTSSAPGEFISARSRVVFAGEGNATGNFYNFTIDTLSSTHGNGNIILMNQATLLSDLSLQPNDTVYVRNGITQPFVGPGHVVGGAVEYFTPYSISAISSANGRISPSGDVLIFPGSNQRFTFIPANGYYLDSVIVDGVAQDSTAGYTFNAVEEDHAIRIVYSPYSVLSQGWNMVSVPVAFSSMLKTDVFPTAIGTVYDYEAGYVERSILDNGVGYWAKFASSSRIGKNDTPVVTLTIHVVQGWNMIGALGVPFLVHNVTGDHPGMITSKFYGYNRKYVPSDTLVPWHGYWVKVNQAGTLTLSTTTLASNAARLCIDDDGEQPPPPPDEGIDNNTQTHPSEYLLSQNYPNPFNPNTGIAYALPADSYVRLTIYNTLGQEIAILLNGVQTAGYKEVQWNAGEKASGLYFYRLDASAVSDLSRHFSETRKMLMIR